mgnify:CR=1 FL=1
MNNKSVFIRKLITAFFATMILLSAIIKNNDIISKIFILPFLVCSIASAGKNLCLIINKNKVANVFNKIFVITFFIFWFCFLAVWCYLNIKDNNYIALLFSLPFWVIGISFVRKFLFKTNKQNVTKDNETKI